MKWIIEDLSRAIDQLKRWQTWLIIGLIGLFAGFAYLIARFAFRTDALLIFLHRTIGACRELSDGVIIFLFCGMIFFFFAVVLTLGEFQRYFELRQRAAHYETGQALRLGVTWALVALGIASGSLYFLNGMCY